MLNSRLLTPSGRGLVAYSVRNGSGLGLKYAPPTCSMFVRHATTTISNQSLKNGRTEALERQELPPHSLLPTNMLLRSLLVSTVSSRPFLLNSALNFMLFLTKKRYVIFDVNKNPILHAILKRTFYNHFCAGENGEEVTATIRSIKNIGFKGVILTYAREVVVDESTKQERGLGLQAVLQDGADNQLGEKSKFAEIRAWQAGVLETVEMVGESDFLALKFTGAGPDVTEALKTNAPLPKLMQDALESICTRALERNVRILVDAEHQSVQPAIDAVALDLMSKYNRGKGDAIVYNTYQMYLKSMTANLNRHMQRAARDGHALGVKIVRGAYMNSEPRELIHDTKADTDRAYDGSVKAMLQGKWITEADTKANVPRVDLFVASHNKESALSAMTLYQEQVVRDLPTVGRIQYGQLLGMADEVSCGLLQKGVEAKSGAQETQTKVAAPEVYKCLSWGTLEDCLSYLTRRAVENKDAVSRTKSEQMATKRELWRRARNSVGLST